jgi:hypothetical protein
VFQLLATGIDVSNVLSELDARAALWGLFTGRQNAPGSAHADTECIVLRGPAVPDLESVFTDLTAYDYPVLHALPRTVDLLVGLFNAPEIPKVDLGRVMVVKLKAGGVIAPHIDEGAYAEHYNRRWHLVLSSENGNLFRNGSEAIHMHPGQLWQFDHRVEHEVWNHSNAPRIHVIIDGRVAEENI